MLNKLQALQEYQICDNALLPYLLNQVKVCSKFHHYTLALSADKS